MTLRDSSERKVREAGVVTRTGNKWSASTSVKCAESLLQHRDIVGNTCTGRQGLVTGHFQQWNKAEGKDRRDMVITKVRTVKEQKRRSKAVELGKQGAWTRWELPDRRITWSDLWRMEPVRIFFLLRSVYDTLPSPTNLCMWGMSEDPSCSLCGSRASMGHILSACKTALQQGRYRWRHDQVLAVLADSLEKERKQKRQRVPNDTSIQFVKAGQTAPASQRGPVGILHQAASWDMRTYLRKKLVFPDVVHTKMRPDIVLWSAGSKKIILIELTVPWEDSCDEAFERKSSKYADLVEDCRQKGWRSWLFPVEVGAKGFPAQSVWRMFQKIGVTGTKRKTAIKRLAEAAERASCWLWCIREVPTWSPDNSE